MKFLITPLILAIVLIAGCTQLSSIGAQTGIGITNIGDIVKNPEKYENKTVTITGTTTGGFPIKMKLIDDQGYLIELRSCEESGRSFEYGIYKATGIIKFYQTCICVGSRTPIETCENYAYGCQNDTIESVAYLECTEHLLKIS